MAAPTGERHLDAYISGMVARWARCAADRLDARPG
jgi:hypothetical protein